MTSLPAGKLKYASLLRHRYIKLGHSLCMLSFILSLYIKDKISFLPTKISLTLFLPETTLPVRYNKRNFVRPRL